MAEESIPELSPEEVRREKKRQANHEWYLRHREQVIARIQADRAAHPEIYKERSRRTAAKRKRDHKAAYQRARAFQTAYRAAHRERRNAASRAWYLQQLEQQRQRCRAWGKTHLVLRRLARHRRRARVATAPVNDFTDAQWEALCKAVDYRCCYCGRTFTADELTPDHLTPYVKHGSNTLHNILPCCGRCNSRKKDRAVLKPVQPFLLLPEDDAAAD